MQPTTTRSFVRSYLPWLIAAGMLLLYLVTLNKNVTLASIMPVARQTGLDWHPTYLSPFTWLVTLPVRWFPANLQLLALNVIGALCATLTVALLARSVILLPHDRTHDQRMREQNEQGLLSLPTAWIPPLFAVLLFGLQRTFWENAIVCTGETVDTLLIAYVIRCLLEYRASGRDSWLYKLALVYGIGITNDFAFIAYAPAMLVALVWVKALGFFQYKFLTRLALFGLAGLSLYLLLPIVQSGNDVANASLMQSLRYNLGYQKNILLGYERWRGVWLGGYPLALILLASIRWSSGFGDTSRIGSIIGTAVAHLAHLVLLAFTVWMAFDLAASPRQLGAGLAFLGSYYIAALAAGYFIGYLLLVFSDFSRRSRKPAAAIMVPLSYLVTILVCTTAVVVPVKLARDNWPRIKGINSPHFRDYAKLLLDSLPQQPSVVVSDDPARLFAVALVGGEHAGHVFIDSHSLREPGYWRHLQRKYRGILPALPAEEKGPQVSGFAMMKLLADVKAKRELYYLQPSFGFFFETYYLEPHNVVFKLQAYPTNSVEAPVPGAAMIAAQNDYWNRLAVSTLRPLEEHVKTVPAEQKNSQMDLGYAVRAYSQLLDWWGVELQRANQYDAALKFFEEALKLFPDNAAAYINKQANLAWTRNKKRIETLDDVAVAKLKTEFGGIEGLLNHSGPVDEPSFRYQLAQMFAQNGLWRQAAQHTLRAIHYAPDDLGLQVMLANLYIGSGQPDRALSVVDAGLKSRNVPRDVAVEFRRTTAAAHFIKGDYDTAEKLLRSTVEGYPEQDGSFQAFTQYYISRADQLHRAGKTAEAMTQLTNALRVAEQHVQQQPSNTGAHLNVGNLLMRLGDLPRAIATFTRVTELDPKNSAGFLNRAIANLQAGKLDEARRDYEKVLELPIPGYDFSYKVHYGLGEIAYRKKDWKAARENYEKYLKNFPPADEAKFVRSRLAELKKK